MAADGSTSGAGMDQVMKVLKQIQEDQARLLAAVELGDRSALPSKGVAQLPDAAEKGLTASPPGPSGFAQTPPLLAADAATERDTGSFSSPKSAFTSRIILT